jgi:hypothetical protein
MEKNLTTLIKKMKTEKEKPKETESKPSVSCVKESYIDDMEIRLRNMRNELSIIGKKDEASLLDEAINNLDSIHMCPENVPKCQEVLSHLRVMAEEYQLTPRINT